MGASNPSDQVRCSTIELREHIVCDYQFPRRSQVYKYTHAQLHQPHRIGIHPISLHWKLHQ